MRGRDPLFSSLAQALGDEAALRGWSVWQLVTWILRGWHDARLSESVSPLVKDLSGLQSGER